MSPDDLTAELAKAKKIADGLQFACRLPDRKPDFTFCGGPAAEQYWEYFTPARIAGLLAALDEALAAVGRHTQWFYDKTVRRCGGCLQSHPCPDNPERGRIAAILNGEGSG